MTLSTNQLNARLAQVADAQIANAQIASCMHAYNIYVQAGLGGSGSGKSIFQHLAHPNVLVSAVANQYRAPSDLSTYELDELERVVTAHHVKAKLHGGSVRVDEHHAIERASVALWHEKRRRSHDDRFE